MHIRTSYMSATDPGALSHPTLKTRLSRHHDSRFAEEINEAGVYIHKLSRRGDPINEQFDKLEEHTIPTPATFVGIGLHRTYNMGRWESTSGLVFAPDTVSLLSYKGDVASVRLTSACNRNFSHFSKGDAAQQYADYAKYLSESFNTRLGATRSAFNNRKPKCLRLVEDVSFAKAKYRELELRSNLAFLRADEEQAAKFTDVSSKHLIAAMLEPTGKQIDSWTKSSLLKELKERTAADSTLRQIVDHAEQKIERFRDDTVTRRYLRRGTEPPAKSDHYKEIMQTWGAQTPNEHLLLPRLEDVAGVCVCFDAVHGVDQSLAINKELRKRQKMAGIRDRDNPALIYHLSFKEKTSLVHVGWSQHVLPWSSKGLIEFAKCGQINSIDNREFKPDHFKLIDKLANSSALVFFERERVVYNCTFTKNFVDDLSSVKENGANLLHLAIASDRDLDTIKFLYFWNVDTYTEKNADGKTAFDLARENGHPSYEFLRDALSRHCDARKLTMDRDSYIAQRLDALRHGAIHTGSVSYSLRNDTTETGKVSFIPELGSYRVVDGEFRAGLDRCEISRGIRAYDVEKGEMALSVGSVVRAGIRCEVGIWKASALARPYRHFLLLGYVHSQEQKHRLTTTTTPETIYFVSKIPEACGGIQFTIKHRRRRQVEARIEGCLQLSPSTGKIDVASSSYFKVRAYIPKAKIDTMRVLSAHRMFGHLQISEENLDSRLSEEERLLIICKYALTSMRYLRAWQDSIEALKREEQEHIKQNGILFIEDIRTAYIEQRQVLDEILDKHGEILDRFLVQRDKDGRCLYQEILPEYLHSVDPAHAKVQFMIGRWYENGSSEAGKCLEIARGLYEAAATHHLPEAEFAFSRFQENGLGGLKKDRNLALALLKRAADNNLEEAKAALRRKEHPVRRVFRKASGLFRPG